MHFHKAHYICPGVSEHRRLLITLEYAINILES
uniref:Uncharacterized protein n=1 Tax=Rhizophora mucronata TaxID=61149 RepID=A0A2P2QP30_RHIMU